MLDPEESSTSKHADPGAVTAWPETSFIAAFIAMIVVLVFDLTVELGVAAAVPYGVVVLLSYFTGSRQMIFSFAAVCTLLTLVGLVISGPGGEPWKVYTNRGLAIAVIWTIAFLCQHIRRASDERVAAAASMHEELERQVSERTADLVRANEATEESNRELRQFAYVASHDLKTPLRGIANFAQFLDSEYSEALDDNARDYIQRIVRGAKRMQKLIDDLLEYSRLEAPGDAVAEVDLEDVLGRVTELLEPAIEEAEAEVTHEHLPVVIANTNHMTQLLLNLIQNGIKYRGEQKPHIHVAVAPGEERWVLSVRDNGIGIDERFHDKVFEVFRRLHTQHEYSGTGIGLAVCRRIATKAGGRIWLTSRPGAGSTFYVECPNFPPRGSAPPSPITEPTDQTRAAS